MITTTQHASDPVLQAASDWWVRLRAPDATEADTLRWLDWVEADERHMAAFQQVCGLAEQLGSLDADDKARYVAEFASTPSSRRRWPLVLGAVAASVLVVALGTQLLRQRNPATTQAYASSVAQTQRIALPDGSSIELGAASSLTTVFARGQRQVDLAAGEAFFHVTHDEQRPFVVNAGPLSILDLGTAFNVRRTGERVVVAVTEGRVRVSPTQVQEQAGMAGVDVTAGHQVSFDPASSSMSVSPVSVEQATAWRSHRLEFVNEPLAAVVANVNRYTQRPLRIADADLGGLTFTGTVKTDAIDSWISALPRVFPVKVERYPDHVELARAAAEERRQ